MKSTKWNKCFNGMLLIGIATLILACNQVKETTKETLKKGGEVVGKGASEFIDGVSDGIDQKFECKVKLSDQLVKDGIQTGIFKIVDDSLGHSKNVLTVYFIFSKSFNKSIMVKAYNKSNLEIGRVSKSFNQKEGQACYCDFIFDNRTKIENKGLFILE